MYIKDKLNYLVINIVYLSKKNAFSRHLPDDSSEQTKDAFKKNFFNTRILRKKIISTYKILYQILSVGPGQLP